MHLRHIGMFYNTKSVIFTPSTFMTMAAKKTLSELTTPSADNVPIGSRVNVRDVVLDLKTGLVTNGTG